MHDNMILMRRNALVGIVVTFVLLFATITVSGQQTTPKFSETTVDPYISAASVTRMIYVDDDFNESTPGWHITRFNTIEDGLEAVPEHGILYVYNGLYQEGELLVDKTISFIGENKQYTIVDGSIGLHDETIKITADHVRMKGFTVKNTRLFSPAVSILSHHITLASNIIDGFAYGVLLDGYMGDTSFTTITRNEFVSSGIIINGEQLSLWNTHTITGNTIHGAPLYYYKNSRALQVPSDAGQVIFANCSSSQVPSLVIPEVPSAIQIGFSHDIIVQQSIFEGRNINWPSIISTAVFVYHSQNVILTGNTISGYYFGLFLQMTTHSVISENMISDSTAGFYSYDCTDDTIKRNMFTHNPDQGIILSYSTHMVVSNNTIDHSERGISLLFSANDNTLIDNVVSANGYGISLASACLRNTITKNTITNNGYGVHLFVDSRDNTISGNIIADNDYGLTFEGAGFNQVFENDIINNSLCGIQLIIHDEYWEQFWSNGNLIYHNNFMDNTQQAYDECFNIWNQDLPSGGNYWSDYQGVDVNPPDGIGDTPYNITGSEWGNQDRFPFMNPGGWRL
ncbi:MAG: NosD domain-containing protein [Methanobacteriota archaeon]